MNNMEIVGDDVKSQSLVKQNKRKSNTKYNTYKCT